MATIPEACDNPDRMPSENGVAASYPLGGVWVLVLRGEIDLDGITPVRHQVSEALRHGGTPVLFDMSQVSFCDSSTLNLLMRTRRETAVAVVRPTAWVERLLHVAGIRDLLPVFDTVEEAAVALLPGRTGCTSLHRDGGSQAWRPGERAHGGRERLRRFRR